MRDLQRLNENRVKKERIKNYFSKFAKICANNNMLLLF